MQENDIFPNKKPTGQEIFLCSLWEIPERGSKGFILETNNGPQSIMVIRIKKKVFSYINSCPHIGMPLDFTPGAFLDYQKKFIICSTHGALFRIDDGYCVSGPCQGKKLKAVDSIIKKDQVMIIF